MPAYGRHNISNATAVIGNPLCSFGFDMDLAAEHLKTFSQVLNVVSIEKIISGTVVIDDFAHHPTEIIATLDAARQKYPSKEIVATSTTYLHTYHCSSLLMNLLKLKRSRCCLFGVNLWFSA